MTNGADGTGRDESMPPEQATTTQRTSTDAYGHETDANIGLRPPQLLSTAWVTGESTPRLRIENKRRRRKLQREQEQPSWWTTHEGNFTPPQPQHEPIQYRNNMCPRGLALHHPAASLLKQYAVNGCPTDTGAPWTLEQIQAAIDRGPHVSALVPAAMEQLDMEVQEKVASGQARIVRWNDIRHAPPPQLKISPVAMVPHNSRPY